MADEVLFDRLIGLVYDAAAVPELWSAALRSIGDALGGCAFIMSILGSCREAPFVTGARVDPDSIALLGRSYATAETNPLLAAMPRLPLATPVARETIQADREYFRGELYNEVFRRQRLAHTAVACVLRTPECTVPLGILRPTGRDRPDRRDLNLLARLLPHIQQSARLSLRLSALEAKGRIAEEALDRLPFGVILLAADGKVLFLNRSAEAVAAAADGLTVRQGALFAASAGATRTLRQLIEDAAAVGTGAGTSPGGAIALRRPSLRRPLHLSVMPIGRGHGGVSLGPGARAPAAIVIITDPELTPEPPEAALRQLHGLTPAEAALAKALAAGKSVQDYADQAAVTRETARWHLKQVFAKTDTRRQADLVRLLLTTPILPQPWF